MAFETQTTNIINLAAKMNSRQNNQTLNIDPNTTSIEFVSLTNADLFNTQSLSARLGIADISNGIINASGGVHSIINTDTNLASGTATGTFSITNNQPGVLFDYPGTFLIPSGNGNNIFSGSIHLSDTLSLAGYAALGAQVNYDYAINLFLYSTDQVPFPASGLGFMSGNTGVASQRIVHDISLSGNYNVPPYPVVNKSTPLAISNTQIYNPGPYVFDGVNYSGNSVDLTWIWRAPFHLESGTVYFIEPTITLTSGTSNRGFSAEYVQNGAVDLAQNTRLEQEFFYIGAPFPQLGALRPSLSAEKGWIRTNIHEYRSPSYLLIDQPTATNDLASPLVSGLTFNGTMSNENVVNQTIPFVTSLFDGSNRAPNFDTTTVEFGEVVTIPSGTWTIFGSYFFATPNDRPFWSNYTRNKSAISGNGYNLGYVANFSKINNYSGTIAAGDFKVNDRTILTSYTGNYVFPQWASNNVTGNNTINPPSYNLNKIYALYDNPITLTGASTGTQYLLSFKYYDFQSGGPYTDYSYRNITTGPFAPTTQFQSFIQHGFDSSTYLYPSGAYVTNYTNNGNTFQEPSGTSVFLTPTGQHLTCGLLHIASGNGITSVYDYRVGDNRSQQIMVTQRNELRSFLLDTPNIQTVLYTGATIGNNFKWSHSTFQNHLFSHQYSQTSGVTWDQIYLSNVTGNSVQPHGLRPTFWVGEVPVATGTAGTGTGASYLSSGTDVDIMLGTQLFSGGIRSSEIQNISTTGNAAYIALTGTDIFNPGLYPTGSQYAFDPFPQSTYVFTTENSGVTFYLAELYTGTSVNTLSLANNPVSNTGTFPLYMKNVTGPTATGSIVLTQQIPNVIINPQEYLTNQIPVPKLKKTIVWKNTLWGIGDPDNPSRLWYSEIQAPNILGVDTNFFGFIDVDNDNGQELTGVEIFKDYMILFKQNSTYRLNYTANPSLPVDVFQLSNTIGNLGIFNTVSTDYGVFGLSQFGPILASYAGADTIGDEILPTYQQFDHQDLIFAVAIHDRERQQIYWSISSQNISPDRNIGLTYSYAEKAWTLRQAGMWNAGNPVLDLDQFTRLYTGDVLGQIQQLNVGSADSDILFNDSIGTNLTRNITLQFETPWLNLDGNSQTMKQVKSMRINCESSAQRLRVDVYFDQKGTTKKYTRYLKMNVPVINRVVSLAQTCRQVKFVVTSVGDPAPIQVNSFQFNYIPMGNQTNI